MVYLFLYETVDCLFRDFTAARRWANLAITFAGRFWIFSNKIESGFSLGISFIAMQFESLYNLLQLFYNFCRNKHGKGRSSMNYKKFQKPNKIRCFSDGRSGIKAYKAAVPQIPTMKSIEK
ncbi:hypothetical protein [Lacrimispora saccharolytica]|nr:hypothetical protein [Lacrimispora saccharolytica]QRV18109.1 hypothetical protein I6K70_11030 [Lacrimispora saccharolytica]